MLNRETYLSAAMAAKDLNAVHGLKIAPRLNSAIETLFGYSDDPFQATVPGSTAPVVKGIVPTPSASLSGSGTADARSSRAVEMAMDSRDGQSLHTTALLTLQQELSKPVIQHMAFARTEVAPRVTDLAEKMMAFIASAKPVSPSTEFEVVKLRLPALVLDESFVAMGLENANADVTEMVPQYAGLSFAPMEKPEDYLAAIQLPNDRLNGLMKDWLATLPEHYLVQAFFYYFSNQSTPDWAGGGSTGIYKYFSDNGQVSPYRRLTEALVCYLYARAFLLSPPASERHTLSDVKERLAKLRDSAADIILASIRRIQSQYKNNVLVVEAIASKKQISVNAELYQEWLEAGGSPEILFGMLVSGRLQFALDQITADKDRYQKAWMEYMQLAEQENTVVFKDRFRVFVKSTALQDLTSGNVSESEAAYRASNPNYLDHATKLITQMVDHSPALMKDLYATALMVIGQGRYYYTSAYDILNDIKLAAGPSDEMDVRECALVSLAKYLARYLADQLTVSK